MAAQVQPAAVCQICLHPIFENQETVACPDCQAQYHRECREELGGCATYGCAQMLEVKKADGPSNWWGTTEKRCPMCAETIPVSSLECPYCHTSFAETRPISKEELLPTDEDPSKRAYQRGATWLLLVSLAGVTSPLALLAGGAWYLARRNQIAQAGAMVRATVLISLAICLIWIVVLGGGYGLFKVSSFNAAGGEQ